MSLTKYVCQKPRKVALPDEVAKLLYTKVQIVVLGSSNLTLVSGSDAKLLDSGIVGVLRQRTLLWCPSC